MCDFGSVREVGLAQQNLLCGPALSLVTVFNKEKELGIRDVHLPLSSPRLITTTKMNGEGIEEGATEDAEWLIQTSKTAWPARLNLTRSWHHHRVCPRLGHYQTAARPRHDRPRSHG